MQSYSQHGQDVWAFRTLRQKKSGFFIELGAFDGITGSNTLMLEQVGWQGICIEPAHWYFERLCENRSCICVNALIAGGDRPTATFLQSPDQMSGIADHRSWQAHEVHKIEMQTRPMVEVLRQCRAPREIDYLSLDVEGAEMEILRDFPYGEYQLGLLTVEHNAASLPERISVKNEMCRLLGGRGYRYVGDLVDDGLFCKPEWFDGATEAWREQSISHSESKH